MASATIIHQDIIENHILPRLDCVSLASLSCTSSYFHTLSSNETIWRDICKSTWPSLNDPRVIQIISTFPNTYHSFFTDCFPQIEATYNKAEFMKLQSCTSQVVSAIDVWHKNRPIFSKIIKTETGSSWFMHSPFRIDLLDTKEVVVTTIKISDFDDDMWEQELEREMSVSWIIVDPTLKRAGNVSSLGAVSVQRQWLTGEVRIEYATILKEVSGKVGLIECKVVLMCGVWREKGELYVREGFMQMEDMDGNHLNGRDSLRILVSAMRFGKRKRRNENEDGRKRHQEYMKLVRQRHDRKVSIERMFDVAFVACISIFLTFFTLYLVGR